MRIDKFLKVSRIIKRRTIANEVCTAGKVKINEKVVKSGANVAVGDIIEIVFGEKQIKYKVLQITAHSNKENAANMYEMV